jgi:hypothetical protein
LVACSVQGHVRGRHLIVLSRSRKTLDFVHLLNAAVTLAVLHGSRARVALR